MNGPKPALYFLTKKIITYAEAKAFNYGKIS